LPGVLMLYGHRYPLVFGGAAADGEPGQRPSSHSIKARWLAGQLHIAHLALCWRGCLRQAGRSLIPQAGLVKWTRKRTDALLPIGSYCPNMPNISDGIRRACPNPAKCPF
jgi:hypothetical protein